MESLFQASDISAVIQLAVAPVFLLASISGTLSVLSLRMGRIIDRGRKLNEMECDKDSALAAEVDYEQQLLANRAKLINRAIALCTLSATFVCLVIVVLFLDAVFNLDIEVPIAVLFVLALACLISALLTFLHETRMSLNAFSFGPHKVSDPLRLYK